jgi:hypothetical protein
MILDQAAINAGFDFRRYAMKPSPANPAITRTHVLGSGTAATATVFPTPSKPALASPEKASEAASIEKSAGNLRMHIFIELPSPKILSTNFLGLGRKPNTSEVMKSNLLTNFRRVRFATSNISN